MARSIRALQFGEGTTAFYRAAPFVLIFAIILGGMFSGNYAAPWVYLVWVVLGWTIAAAVGRFVPLEGDDNEACNFIWPFESFPNRLPPTTLYYWLTFVYFLVLGVAPSLDYDKKTDNVNVGVIVITALFVIFDFVKLWALPKVLGQETCYQLGWMALSAAVGSAIGAGGAFASTAMLRQSGKSPTVSCSKPGSQTRGFRCRVRKEKITI